MIDNIYNKIEDQLLGYVLILIGSIFILIILFGIFLDKYNKLVCGKVTILAYLPAFNNYLIGKLLVNKFFGYIMVFLMIIPLCIPNRYVIISGVLFDAIIYICAIIKYAKLKKAKEALENNVSYVEENIVFNIKPNVAIDSFNDGMKHIIPTNEEIEKNVKFENGDVVIKKAYHNNSISDSKQKDNNKEKDPSVLFEPQVIIAVVKEDSDIEEI